MVSDRCRVADDAQGFVAVDGAINLASRARPVRSRGLLVSAYASEARGVTQASRVARNMGFGHG